jgi:hypothetical protein
MFDDFRQRRLPGLDHPAGGVVGVHQVYALFDEVLSDGALAAANAARQAKNPGFSHNDWFPWAILKPGTPLSVSVC